MCHLWICSKYFEPLELLLTSVRCPPHTLNKILPISLSVVLHIGSGVEWRREEWNGTELIPFINIVL
jgi:hypothetical protein